MGHLQPLDYPKAARLESSAWTGELGSQPKKSTDRGPPRCSGEKRTGGICAFAKTPYIEAELSFDPYACSP